MKFMKNDILNNIVAVFNKIIQKSTKMMVIRTLHVAIETDQKQIKHT